MSIDLQFHGRNARVPRLLLSGVEKTSVCVVSDCEKAWDKAVSDVLTGLQDLYADVDIRMAEDHMDAASLLPDGQQDIFLLLSRGFLEGMAAGKDAFEEGRAMIEELLSQIRQNLERLQKAIAQKAPLSPPRVGFLINGRGEAEPLFTTMMDTKQTGVAYKKKEDKGYIEIKTDKGTIRISLKKRLYYRPSRDMARLARVNTIRDVKSVISGVYAQMNRTRADSSIDSAQREAEIAQMKRVVMRAQTKIKNLQDEDIMQSGVKKAIEEKRVKKAALKRHQLNRRRQQRKIREYGQIHEFDRPHIERKAEYDQEQTQSVFAGIMDNERAEMQMQAEIAIERATAEASAGISEGNGGIAPGSIVNITI